MQQHPTVHFLLGDNSPLFDIQKPILQSLVLPVQSYGLKDICKHPKLVNFHWQDEKSGSQWAVVQFHRFLRATNKKIRAVLKENTLSYNRDDVRATHAIEVWLRSFS